MNVFKKAQGGFDSVISAGTTIRGSLVLEAGTTLVLNGTIERQPNQGTGNDIAVDDRGSEDRRNTKTTLVVNGTCKDLSVIEVPNLTITGIVTCEAIFANVLAIKKGALVTAKRIHYRTIIIETGAIITGEMTPMVDAKSNSEPASIA